jgi:hypothetical protein
MQVIMAIPCLVVAFLILGSKLNWIRLNCKEQRLFLTYLKYKEMNNMKIIEWHSLLNFENEVSVKDDSGLLISIEESCCNSY